MTYNTIREFRTKNFTVRVVAEPDYDLDLSFDESGEVADKVESGEYVAFCAHAYVVGPNGETLADDYLGGCIYESYDAFMDHRACGRQNRENEAQGKTGRCGSYFVDMVHEVCTEARKALLTAQSVKVRTV